MTAKQKAADMLQTASLYTKAYAPYEWKRDTIGFDLMDLDPWLDRAANAADDLAFMDLLVEYVSSLNDAHDNIAFPSDFFAYLGFDVDIYDGKVLVDLVNRSLLPAARYPFVTGDELLSVDGTPVDELVRAFSKYATSANARSTARSAADRITFRDQATIPRAFEIGATATVVIRRANGAEETYSVPWLKSGTPIRVAGPVGSPTKHDGAKYAAPGPSAEPVDDSLPEYMAPLMPLLKARVPVGPRAVQSIGARTPLFALPSGFVQRLGRQTADVFYSGTYTSSGVKIGYLRIPDFEPSSATFALQQLDTEIRFFQQNTDGLIVDVMRNPGGFVSYVESVAQRLLPQTFRTIGFEIRATSLWVASMSNQVVLARNSGYPQWVIDQLQSNLDAVSQAHSEFRGRTGPVSLNQLGTLDLPPVAWAYTKPVMLLVDEFSASGAEAFAAIVQDNQRGPLFGYRTMGAGGTVIGYDASNYTEGFAGVTTSLMNRKAPIDAGDYPAAPYVENIGVRPEIVEDYMTRENLMNRGRPFADRFTKAMLAYINAIQQ